MRNFFFTAKFKWANLSPSVLMCALDANVNIYANFKLVSRVYLKESGNMLCINEITYKVRASWGKSHFISIQFSTVDIHWFHFLTFLWISIMFHSKQYSTLNQIDLYKFEFFFEWVVCGRDEYFAHTLRIRGTADIFKNVDETVQIILSGSYEFKKKIMS